MRHTIHPLRGAASRSAVLAMAFLLAACGTSDADLGAGESVEPTATVPIAWTESASPVATDDYCGYEEPIVDPALRGTPDISPSLSPAPGEPAFTEEDVRRYVEASPPEFWDETTPRPVVKRIEFMSACEVATKVNHPVYRPDDTLLALVTLTGEWKPKLPPGVKPIGTPAPNTVMYLIFDATSGHLVGRTFGHENP